MSLQVEKLENNTAKLTIEVPAEEFDKAIQAAYQKNKNKFNVPGFRKGKVPYAMVEKMYGAGVFYEEAANELIPDAYANAAAESELEIVARPEINVTQIEKGKPFVFEAEVTLKPEIKLGKYKGVKVEAMDTTVTDEDVAAELDKVKEQNARLVAADDKAVEDGDQTTIDFEGFVDGVAFEGGKGEDYPLTIGSHSFIDTFEEQLIGKKVGEEVEVNVTFPEQYQAKELAGKPAMFKVTIKEIKVKEYPELDDDFAQDVSEFDTLDEYKADIKKNLEEKKAQEAEADKESKVIENTVGNIFSGQVVSETAKTLSDRFGKVLQKRQSMTINRNDKSTSISTQMDSLIPPSKISNLTQGMFVGAVSDNFDERIEQKIFHAEIVVDNEKMKRETASYKKLPQIIDFRDEDGNDRMQEEIQANYNRVKQEVQQIVTDEMERIKNDPDLQHLLRNE